MKHFLILPAVAGAFLLTSCELEEQIEPAEEAYTKAFIKEFGIIDPNQDWNMATRGSVTVNTPSATEVKIYANIDGEYRIAGDFSDVSGSKTLEFDIPRGVTDVMVEAGGMSKSTNIGGSVSFSNASRAIHLQDGTSTGGIKVEVATGTDGKTLYETFEENNSEEGNETGVYEYRATLPEDNYNLNKVIQNFHFTSDAEKALTFVLYPVYWQTNAVNEIGIAYGDKDNITRVPVYTIKSGEELCGLGTYAYYTTFYLTSGEDEIKENPGDQWNTPSTQSKIYIKDNKTYTNFPIDLNIEPSTYTDVQKESVMKWVMEQLNIPAEKESSISATWDATQFYVSYSGDAWRPITNIVSTQDANAKEYTQFRSQGIKVTIPANTSFAFYIKNNGNGQTTSTETEAYYMYSRAEWNGDKHVHAATFENKAKERCIAFEDWYGGPLDAANPDEANSGGGDLNDVVLYTDLATEGGGGDIVPDDPTPANTYIVAAEDLGKLDDFDFNDVVIQVSYTSGKISSDGVKVKAMAAGGTLPVHLYYTNKNNEEVLIEGQNGTTASENGFHSCFSDGSISSGTMINTTSYTDYGKEFTIMDMPDDFTMTSGYRITGNKTTNMGGFYIKVERSDGNTETKDGLTTTVTAPEEGTAPQMICVPSSWEWPIERHRINAAYPAFMEWGGGYNNKLDWDKNKVADEVISR